MSLPLRVAVVGAGPAGIYAADILTTKDPDGDRRHLRPAAHPVRTDPLRRRPRPPADQGDHRRPAPGDGERAHPVHRQRARRRRPQGRRAAAVLRRGHLRHRRRAGPRAADPRRGTATAPTVRPTSSPSTTPTRTASRPGTCPSSGRSPSSASATSAWTSPGCSPAPPTNCWPPTSRRTCTRCWPNSAITDVHMFARRGPAQAKFTPVELRELDHSPNVQVVVAPEGMEFDAESQAALSPEQVAADGRRRAQRLGDAGSGARPAPPDPPALPGEPDRDPRRGRRGRRAAHRASGTDRRRQRPRHRRVHRLGRAGGLPGGRLPVGGHRGPAVRHPPVRAAERRRPGAGPGRRRRCPACTRPGGSSAARSG